MSTIQIVKDDKKLSWKLLINISLISANQYWSILINKDNSCKWTATFQATHSEKIIKILFYNQQWANGAEIQINHRY